VNPEVTVVIATRDRPEMLREAIGAVRSQTGVDGIEVIVVFDHSEPDPTLATEEDGFGIRVITNSRKPGLAGARNSGILEARGRYVAFCDDDDYWLPGKLAAQVAALRGNPASALVSCGILVDYDGQRHVRFLDRDVVTFEDLLRDRLTELHPSTFLFRRAALTDEVGLVSEDVPGGFGEDYELLLRTARHAPIVNLRTPYTVVRWHQSSFFFRRWQMMSEGLQHVMTEHPEITGDRRGNARMQGQIAFAEASRGSRRSALRRMVAAGASYPFEPRIYLAALVATGLVKPGRVMTTLHRFGRGI
jgi:glycosyltransferase involved in cell wall biosynthesis